jgi:hypothetical protein
LAGVQSKFALRQRLCDSSEVELRPSSLIRRYISSTLLDVN